MILSEQEDIIDLSPRWGLDGGFTCGSCRLRRNEAQLHAHHGKGGGKWAECYECFQRIRGAKYRVSKLKQETFCERNDLQAM